ncbi:hypothetical protein [Bradyrhizobium sp. SZCCHNS2002]|uniref:hypothetical protein n=1 Tax=Bradyrhizobium sp. SZCCHNS2002 TaxID=3057302 RepID=UPI002916AC7B|nr:hypothetical protein [Bradyrhizobium sp. SZCCHNS2002]
MKSASQKARLIGYRMLSKMDCGFALPVFSHPEHRHNLAIQEIDELTGRIVGFRTLEDANEQELPLNGPFVELGDEQLYVFVSSSNNVHVGTLVALRPKLKQFSEDNVSKSDIALQIAELVGSPEERKIARIRMQKLFLRSQGAAAARYFYEGSALRSALWSCLISTAASEELARRILALRSHLSADINSDGTIALDLSALSENDQIDINREAVISKMLLEFEPAPSSRPDTILEDDSNTEIGIHTANLLHKIKQVKRQEERIAILLSAILDTPLIGKSALLQYQNDNAKFANWALAEIRGLLLNTEWSSDERLIASLIPRFFTRQYPLSRGDLLVFLAKHLGKWPAVRAEIFKCLSRTNSLFVHLRRQEIEEFLTQHEAGELELREVRY